MSPTPRSETILVVDDEPLVLSLTNSMLSRSGYNVVAADSGKAALRLFELWPDAQVDLALIGLNMPEMNGVQLAERIHELRPALPILFFSAYSDQEILRPVFARGLPYIAKPFTSVQLIKRIREVLDRPKGDAENA